MIDRELLYNEHVTGYSHGQTIDELADALDEIAELKQKLDALESQAARASQWISVDERLPSTLEPVVYLRKADNGLMSVGVAYWTVSDKWTPGLCSKHQPEGFTHWRPLPEPPK